MIGGIMNFAGDTMAIAAPIAEPPAGRRAAVKAL